MAVAWQTGWILLLISGDGSPAQNRRLTGVIAADDIFTTPGESATDRPVFGCDTDDLSSYAGAGYSVTRDRSGVTDYYAGRLLKNGWSRVPEMASGDMCFKRRISGAYAYTSISAFDPGTVGVFMAAAFHEPPEDGGILCGR